MSDDNDQKELISVSKNQALGMGGAGVAITTIVALTSTFLTTGDRDALQAQISQNRAGISYLKTEIKDGFRTQSTEFKDAVKEIEGSLRQASRDRWTKSDHDRFSQQIDKRFERVEQQLQTLRPSSE